MDGWTDDGREGEREAQLLVGEEPGEALGEEGGGVGDEEGVGRVEDGPVERVDGAEPG